MRETASEEVSMESACAAGHRTFAAHKGRKSPCQKGILFDSLSRRSERYGASAVFHLRVMAGGCAVAGRDVNVQAAQAVRAVVAVAAPGAIRCHEPPADAAGKAFAAGVGPVAASLV